MYCVSSTDKVGFWKKRRIFSKVGKKLSCRKQVEIFDWIQSVGLLLLQYKKFYKMHFAAAFNLILSGRNCSGRITLKNTFKSPYQFMIKGLLSQGLWTLSSVSVTSQDRTFSWSQSMFWYRNTTQLFILGVQALRLFLNWKSTFIFLLTSKSVAFLVSVGKWFVGKKHLPYVLNFKLVRA